MVGIRDNISLHVSRQSFADYARSSNIDLHTISKLLRHTKLSTTERYLSSFDPISADNAMSKLFGGEE
jgi:site-specific recombinase XerD